MTELNFQAPDGTLQTLRHWETNDAGLRDVLEGKAYWPFRLKTPPAIIADIGANVGSTAFLFWMSYPTATINCYEPSPRNFPTLEQNTRHIPNIIRHQLAVGESARTGFLLHHKNTCMDYVMDEPPPDCPYSEVQVIPATDILPCDVLKIDCEGMEGRILYNLLPHLGTVSVVYVEIHNRAIMGNIISMLNRTHSLIRVRLYNPDLMEATFVIEDRLELKPNV